MKLIRRLRSLRGAGGTGYLAMHAIILVLILLMFWYRAFGALDYRMQDALYQRSRDIDVDIVLIGIDDASLEALGQWPWPRDYHAELVRLLTEGGARAIGLDILFPETSVPEEDDALAEAVRQSGVAVTACYGTFAHDQEIGPVRALSVTRPFPALDSAGETAHINGIVDEDGIVRRTLLSIYESETEGARIESFAYKLYRLHMEGGEAGETGAGTGSAAQNAGTRTESRMPEPIDRIPQDASGRAFIRYAGPPGTFEAIPYYLVLTGEIDPEYFRDKTVLIGPMGIGIADDYVYTPIDRAYPMYGVEAHANILRQMIDGKFWSAVPVAAEFLEIIAFAVCAAVLFRRLRPQIAGVGAVGLIALHLGASGLIALPDRGYVSSLLYIPTMTGLQYIASTVYGYLEERAERSRVTQVFGQYVAPQVVSQILRDGDEALHLGGVRRDITALFVDIRGFTPLSESAEPEVIVQILNEYLSLCAGAIFEFGGTLDKYIGDAAMAIYNAPLDLEQHALRAVQTAWRMKQGSVALADAVREQFGKEVRFGIGIHSGPAIVGNIGANFRLDYTAIGDTVNTAARLESNAAPGQILISEEVLGRVAPYIEYTDLGEIQVKGKTKRIRIFQVDSVRIDDSTISKEEMS